MEEKIKTVTEIFAVAQRQKVDGNDFLRSHDEDAQKRRDFGETEVDKMLAYLHRLRDLQQTVSELSVMIGEEMEMIGTNTNLIIEELIKLDGQLIEKEEERAGRLKQHEKLKYRPTFQPNTFFSNLINDTKQNVYKFELMTNLSHKDHVCLQQWTGLKFVEVVFDSDYDDWSLGTSVLHKKILGKSQLVFVVEDYDGNKFGGYLKEQIHTTFQSSSRKNCSWMIVDYNSFIFQVRKNNGECYAKYPIKDNVGGMAFCVREENDDLLFHFGRGNGLKQSDLRIWKKGKTSNCVPYYYDFPSDALRPARSNFTPKRITVLQFQ